MAHSKEVLSGGILCGVRRCSEDFTPRQRGHISSCARRASEATDGVHLHVVENEHVEESFDNFGTVLPSDGGVDRESLEIPEKERKFFDT